ncbi:hypothetical protein [Paracidovorax wautersii]|uniref:HEPN domain-containing protein n=1 Tax=Paracidovorax wautersii TaxID=1177982 RepID=A0ABU1I6W9_9BURK|nr:hypothetical protein [Paracidovorax wautersii]MDR6212962.1 hypothetical protein [Paracidovorax wautersii]
MTLDPWSANPVWQNFSSLVREAHSAEVAPTTMERSHHLTAALYFGIATLEAFLNRVMRAHLAASKSEHVILEVLRKGRFLAKLDKWPLEIIGIRPAFPQQQRDLIGLCNDVRGNLTHPKTLGYDIYKQLLTVRPDELVDAVATYIVTFHAAQRTRFPYWIFGWNYLNPSPRTHEIFLIHDQQFSFSLRALGFDVPASDAIRSEAWRDLYLKSLEGYIAIKNALDKTSGCEPKAIPFPHQPTLCRRWWMAEHHRSCGHVSKESIAAAKRLDNM